MIERIWYQSTAAGLSAANDGKSCAVQRAISPVHCKAIKIERRPNFWVRAPRRGKVSVPDVPRHVGLAMLPLMEVEIHLAK